MDFGTPSRNGGPPPFTFRSPLIERAEVEIALLGRRQLPFLREVGGGSPFRVSEDKALIFELRIGHTVIALGRTQPIKQLLAQIDANIRQLWCADQVAYLARIALKIVKFDTVPDPAMIMLSECKPVSAA